MSGCRGVPFSRGALNGYLDKVNLVTSIKGHDVTGLYKYEKHPSGRPRVELNRDGSGIFESWGADPSGGPGNERPMRWWLLLNCDGTPMVQVAGAAANGHVLVVEYGPSDVSLMQLAVAHDGGVMTILGERVKRR